MAEDAVHREEARNRNRTDCCSVAAPRPRAWISAEPSAHGIQRKVSAEFDEVPLAVNEHGVKAALEQVPLEPVAGVERLSIEPIQTVHPAREVRFGCLDEEMEVVRHQAVGSTAPAAALANVSEELEETPAIVPVCVNIRPARPPGDDVVDPVCYLNTWCSRHESNLRRWRCRASRALALSTD